MLADKGKKIKAAVPPPEEVKAKMRGLAGKLAGEEMYPMKNFYSSTKLDRQTEERVRRSVDLS